MKRLSTSLLMLLIVSLSLTGCNRWFVQSDPLIVSGDIAQECPELPAPYDGTFENILKAYIEAAEYYYECADKQSRLVDLINAK